MPHKVDVYVGRRMREARNFRKMSQEELGKKLGISFQQIQKYEKGTNRISASRLYEIAAVLKTSVDYFFEGCDDAIEAESAIPRRTIALAHQIESISSDKLRSQVLNLIKACAASQPQVG